MPGQGNRANEYFLAIWVVLAVQGVRIHHVHLQQVHNILPRPLQASPGECVVLQELVEQVNSTHVLVVLANNTGQFKSILSSSVQPARLTRHL